MERFIVKATKAQAVVGTIGIVTVPNSDSVRLDLEERKKGNLIDSSMPRRG